jgi:hypothetical protein
MTTEERESATAFEAVSNWPTKLAVAWRHRFPAIPFDELAVLQFIADKLNVTEDQASQTELWVAVQLINGVEVADVTPPPEVLEATKPQKVAGGTSIVTNAGRRRFMSRIAEVTLAEREGGQMTIPLEYQTEAMTKAEAAHKYRPDLSKNRAVAAVTAAMEAGTLRFVLRSPHRIIFDRRQLQPSATEMGVN